MRISSGAGTTQWINHVHQQKKWEGVQIYTPRSYINVLSYLTKKQDHIVAVYKYSKMFYRKVGFGRNHCSPPVMQKTQVEIYSPLKYWKVSGSIERFVGGIKR